MIDSQRPNFVPDPHDPSQSPIHTLRADECRDVTGGAFIPYPQVPLGWRKVSLEWDDGWWPLDMKG
jgi:hypothetical protein